MLSAPKTRPLSEPTEPMDDLERETTERHSDIRDLVAGQTGKERREPLAAAFGLGLRAERNGVIWGVLGGILLHAAGGYGGVRQLTELRSFTGDVRAWVKVDLGTLVDVAVEEKPEPEPPPPPPEPEPAPTAPREVAPTEAPPTDAPPPADTPYDQPPATAEAGKILAAEPDPSAPLDLTDQGFIQGTGDRFAGGRSTADGKAKTAVRSAAAVATGIPGGKGTGAPPPPTAAVDLSRGASAASTNWSSCGFPAEAEMEQLDYAQVTLVVTVNEAGAPQTVIVRRDPGFGFGAMAKSCAMRQRYNVARDKTGAAVAGTTPPFTVIFTR